VRILKIELPAFKNLRDFTATFDAQSATSMLVGRNGTGKSNLIEALVTIFKDMDAGPGRMRETRFAYSIEYQVHGHYVSVTHNPATTRNRTLVRVDGTELRPARLTKEVRDSILPETIFAYYSGPSNRLESVFEEPLAAFRDAMIRGERDARQRMIYGRLIHSQFVLLSFLAEGGLDDFPFLGRELGIEALESVLFVMRQPYWAAAKQGVERKREFWGAAGIVRSFLDELYAASLAPLQLVQRVPTGIKTYKTSEHLYLFLQNQEQLAGLVDSMSAKHNISRARELFTTLESAYVSDLIADVRVSLRKRYVNETLTFSELSEGEQQLLMVLGLLRFTKEEESLFLLDEPDTHLNPVWSLRFLDLVDEAVGQRDSSQLIVASHDPVAISLLRKHQVRQLATGEQDGRVTVSEPEDDPIRLGISGVLLSEMFGFRSMLAPEVVALIEERDELLTSSASLSADQTERLDDLDKTLAEVDLSSTHPDPLYAQFMRAMLMQDRQELAERAPLSREEALEQRRTAEEIVRRIREREGSE
jgi:predicted ATPase